MVLQRRPPLVIRVKAIYEDGVLKPKQPLEGVADRQSVSLTIDTNLADPQPADPLPPQELIALLRQTFDGLTEEQWKIMDEAKLRKLRD